ncbi:hypothetical protein FOXB_01266 [Fusarium oxysporum f. sp. conglutinans Fo5176]|uniref:BTB domain-containing protein n=1 Tax=Fusarium oxysporum (strain Fo5176) TaxID=660025 RepID=F9F4E1_FUSOF|nr:hypothetical protein FOXB_01266 [Fusarium oxysporum f. sp. conglutinans Fo5176]
MGSKPLEAFGASLKDVVIRCNGQEFAVHSLVLFCHSDYFKMQLTGPWKSQDKIIEIKDFAVDVVEAMIRFVYSFEYDVPADTSAMIFHAKVYQIGDKYGIETLKKQALNKFKDVFVEAEVTADYANDLADTITVVYTTTPPVDRGLRVIVVESSYDDLEELMPETSFKEGLVRNGDFSADLISFINENMEDCWDCKCLSCKYVFAFRIQSSGVIFPALQNPTPIRCLLYGWKPPADTDGDWVYYVKGYPLLGQGRRKDVIEILKKHEEESSIDWV